LSGAGLTEADLRCPPSWPIEPETARRLIARGEEMSRIRMNCSGKHSAMLATCVRNGWDTSSYLNPQHPLQQAILQTVEELAGERVPATGVDGCGAPLFALTLAGLARAFRVLVLAAPGTPERRVADAMRAHPEWTSGTVREERKLMDAVPGLLIKGGAEGVDAFALSDGRGRRCQDRRRGSPGPDAGDGGDVAPARRRRPGRTGHRARHRRRGEGGCHPRGRRICAAKLTFRHLLGAFGRRVLSDENNQPPVVG
jgi:hypothetical protein